MAQLEMQHSGAARKQQAPGAFQQRRGKQLLTSGCAPTYNRGQENGKPGKGPAWNGKNVFTGMESWPSREAHNQKDKVFTLQTDCFSRCPPSSGNAAGHELIVTMRG